MRYAPRQYVTVAVVTRCVLCAVRNRSNMKTLCFTKVYLAINFSSVFQTTVDVFMLYSECDFDPVPADHRTASNSYIKVCLTQCAMSACASIACHIDSLTRNLAIMSHEGRAVVKSPTNGYAGGCHPIRVVISNTTVDSQTVEVGRNAACCVPGSPGYNSRRVRKCYLFQNVHSGCGAHSTSVMYRRVFALG